MLKIKIIFEKITVITVNLIYKIRNELIKINIT